MNVEATDHPPLARRRLLSVDDYHRMAEAGIFGPEERVELIEGEIVTMAPIGPDHSGIVNQLNQLLVMATVGKAIVSPQNPVVLPEHSEPEPDLALLRPRADWYRKAKPLPADVLLLIEVAESTLRYDREVKRRLYAAHGIPEYWVIDLEGSRLVRFSEPMPDGYGVEERVADLRRVDPVTLPGVTLDLSGLF